MYVHVVYPNQVCNETQHCNDPGFEPTALCSRHMFYLINYKCMQTHMHAKQGKVLMKRQIQIYVYTYSSPQKKRYQ